MTIDKTAIIHPSAVIEAGAVIGAGTQIGAYSVIGPDVVLEDNITLHSHVVVTGDTFIGEGTVIFPFASIGHIPQDLKFGGEKTKLIIGRENRIREHATMNPGTDGGGGVTKIGDNNLFMMSIHVGHDCILGDNIVMANNASLGGHCIVEDDVVIGALAGIHQFCRIGKGAMIGGLAAVVGDVIPYGSVTGDRAHLRNLNLTGLKRKQTDKSEINGLRTAYKELFLKEGTLKERATALNKSYPDNPLVQDIIQFILSRSDRSFCTPK